MVKKVSGNGRQHRKSLMRMRERVMRLHMRYLPSTVLYTPALFFSSREVFFVIVSRERFYSSNVEDGAYLHHGEAGWRPARTHWRNHQEIRTERIQNGCHEIQAGIKQLWYSCRDRCNCLISVQPDQALLEKHYGDLKDKPFFPTLVKFMATSPVVCMVRTTKVQYY